MSDVLVGDCPVDEAARPDSPRAKLAVELADLWITKPADYPGGSGKYWKRWNAIVPEYAALARSAAMPLFAGGER